MNAPQQFQPGGTTTPKVIAPPGPQQEVRHRVHHSYVWLEGIRTFVIVAIAVLVANFSTLISLVADGDLDGLPTGLLTMLVMGGALAIVLVVFGVVVATRVVSYRHLYFIVGPDEFALCSGVFNKKRVHVPYQRVQSVDQRATLLQRIFGVCTVSIDTAGGAANKAVVVPYVTKQQAEWLRAELYGRRNRLAAQAMVGAGISQASPAAAAAAPAAPGVPGVATPAAVPGVAVAPVAPGTAAPSVAPGVATSPAVPSVAAPGPAIAPAVAAPAVISQPAQIPGNILDVGAQAWDEVGGLFAGSAVDTGRVTYEYGLTNKELFLAGLSNATSVGLILVGLIVAVGQVVGGAFDLFGADVSDTVVQGAVSLATSQAAASLIGLVSLVVVAIVLVMWLASALGSCISYGGFAARRRAGRIEVEYGLFKHTFQGVSIDRVQSVVVKQSFVRRLLGYCELSLGKVEALSSQEASSDSQQMSLAQQGVIVHPFVKMSRVPEILAGLIPEFADLPREPVPVAKVALRRAVVRRAIITGGGFWLAVVATLCLIVLNALTADVLSDTLATAEDWNYLGIIGIIVTLLYVFAVIGFIIDVVGAVLWARESSFAYNRRFMQVSNGGFSRTTISFPRQKIQFGYVRSNPLQRRAGTKTILATTAAGSGGTTTSLVDVPADDALAWLDWLKPGGNASAS